DTFLDDVPDGLGVRKRAVVRVMCDVAEGVEAEDERESSRSGCGTPFGLQGCCAHADASALAPIASLNSGRRSKAPKTGPPGSRLVWRPSRNRSRTPSAAGQ